jgi:GH18 family chitinase
LLAWCRRCKQKVRELPEAFNKVQQSFIAFISNFPSPEKVVCYYGTWSVWRQGLGRFEVNDIDPKICTHIIYTFFGVTADGGVKYLDPYLDLTDNYGKGLMLASFTPIVAFITISLRLHPKVHQLEDNQSQSQIDGSVRRVERRK